MDSFHEVFELVLERCRAAMPEVAYDLWIKGIVPVSIDGSSAVLQVSSSFMREIVEEKYMGLLSDTFEQVMGFPVKVEIIAEDAAPVRPEPEPEPEFNAEKDYTFENFVVGSSNKLAHAAAWSIANNPDNSSDKNSNNPLFLYGRSGVGKTHLIYAICNEVRKNHPEYRIIYVKSETFANELIAAIKTGETAGFKDKFRQADILAVDDIQFIAGKESTQEEFFHTFNSLYESGRRIILASDRPPKEIKTLEDRLRSRFEWGLIADIQPPDFETRVAIISRKAESYQLELPEDVCKYVATKCKENIRQLEGIVKRLNAHHRLTGAPVTPLMAENVIRDVLTEQLPIPVTVERIIDEVARTYGVSSDDIRGKRRSTQISAARQVAMFVVREITGMSQAEIGKEFGGRDHSTVTYALQQVTMMMENEPQKKEMVEDILKNIRNMNG